MGGQLSARLARIRASAPATDLAGKTGADPSLPPMGKSIGAAIVPPDETTGFAPTDLLGFPDTSSEAGFAAAGWRVIAPYVACRKLVIAFSPGLPAWFSSRLAILSPGSSRVFTPDCDIDAYRLLFFDLETSGLSGGAGTVAFLAAFGRFVPDDTGETTLSGKARLEINQYLLLDYPGESAFLASVNAEFLQQDPIIVSYNGKAFDMQIIRTRFSMNGLVVPDLPHWDLLHAVRRLWRCALPSCSQLAVEQGILGLERSDDLPGSMAPDAWFDFLRNGNERLLVAVGEHNAQDIAGIAHLSVVLDRVAREPLAASNVPVGALAHAWWIYSKKTNCEEKTTDALLEKAFSEGDPRTSLILASRLYKRGSHERSVEIRRVLALGLDGEGKPQSFLVPPAVRVCACRQLATDAERRLKSCAEALRWLDVALSMENGKESDRSWLTARRERLLLKMEKERLRQPRGCISGEIPAVFSR